MAQFVFLGHEVVGEHVGRCLSPLGWMRADDVVEADVAFTYCTSASALEDAYFDDKGLVKRAKPGTLLVDLSPSTPAFARELSAVALVNDLRPVEAPLSVVDPSLPDAFASCSNIVCHVAGEPDDVDEAIDVIETIAGTAHRTGTSGTAQLAKAARTVQMAALIASAVESEALVRVSGAASMSSDSAAVSVMPAFGEIAPLMDAVTTGSYKSTYTVEMLMAEVAAAMETAEEANLILPQLESVMHLLQVIVVIGGVEKAPTALSLMYRDEAASAEQGLDWTRAEGLFADYDPAGVHGHDHGLEDDDFGMYGGIGGYSSN